jgi:3-hydroxyisobutyrate dehydrogenase
MVFDAAAVLEIAEVMASSWPDGAVWIQSATVGLDGIAKVARFAEERGMALLDAPVLGTKEPAQDGKLVPLVSGDRGLRQRAQQVLEAIGTKTVDAGRQVGQGTALKLACNAYIAALTAAVGQSIGLAGALGVDPGLFLEAIDGGPSSSPYAQMKGQSMLAGEYPPSFAVDGVLKDIQLMSDAAQQAGFPQTLLQTLQELYAGTSEGGHGGDDIAAVFSQFQAQ